MSRRGGTAFHHQTEMSFRSLRQPTIIANKGWGFKVLFATTAVILFCILSLERSGAVSSLVGYLSYGVRQIANSNFVEVVPNRVYRSAFMKSAELHSVIEAKGIQSVIDLRRNPKKLGANGLTEEEFLASEGVSYYSVRLNSGVVPGYPSILKLFNTLRVAKEPILIHCTSGTHRSGLASFIWLLEREHWPLDKAIEQLSPRFGYSALERSIQQFKNGRPTLDSLVWKFEKQTKETGISFIDWAKNNLRRTEGVYDIKGNLIEEF